MKLTEKELTTVLAALRYWQQSVEEGEEPPIMEHFADGTEPLTDDKIDDLCERLNCDEDGLKPEKKRKKK